MEPFPLKMNLPEKIKQPSDGKLLALPSAAYLIIFFILPLFFVLLMSVLTRGSNPAEYSLPFTLENFTAIFRQPILNILQRSIWIALVTTVICFVIGYPLAFFISTRQSSWARQAALFFVILPFWTNFLVRTYAWQIILGRRGVFNEQVLARLEDTRLGQPILDFFGVTPPLNILGTEFAVLLGLVYTFLPFMVLPIYATIERFNFRLVEAAHDLGANDWYAFWRVIFPITMPGVVAGWILVFIPSIGAFVTPELLGGTKGFMIGNFINRQFKDAGGSWTLGSGSSVVMMVLVSAALFIYIRYAGEDSYQRTQKNWFDRLLGLVGAVIRLPFALLAGGIAALTKSPAPSSATTIEFSRGKIRRDLFMRQAGKYLLYLNPVFCYLFLWLPIVLLVVYSFNASRRAGGEWEGFSTQWYERIFAGVSGTGGSQFSTAQMLESVETSLIVSLISTVIATILGTMVAIALVRGAFSGKRWLDGLLYLPVVIPDITMGVSLLVFFRFVFDLLESAMGKRFFPGMMTVIIAHVAFNISYVAIVVRARLADMNPRFEEAARDLGANEWRTFWRVTYPLLLPGIIAGALLAFTISLDDFVVTFFVGGGTTTTLTVFVWGLVRRGVSPEINAVSALMIVASTVLIALSLVLQNRSTNRS